MCSYWRRSLEPTPRRRLPLGMMPPPRELKPVTVRLGTNRVLTRLRRRVDLLLRHVQHILGLLADRANHVGRTASNADGPALCVFTDLFAPVPDGEPSDERSENESKHRRPPFVWDAS